MDFQADCDPARSMGANSLLSQVRLNAGAEAKQPELNALLSRVHVLTKLAAEGENVLADFLSRVGVGGGDGDECCNDAARPAGVIGELGSAVEGVERRLSSILSLASQLRRIA